MDDSNTPVIAGGNSPFEPTVSWPPTSEEISGRIAQCVQSGDWGRYHGSQSQELTALICDTTGRKFARLCSSGTIATEIALRSIPIESGDEVILAGYDFPGNFRAIESAGGFPVLAELKQDGWSIDFDSIVNAVSANTKAIVVSHLHGSFAEVKKICSFAKDNNICVIEDICQCPGAKLGGQFVGSLGDIVTLSFGGSKLLTAGRGGAILTDREDFVQRATIFCERGNEAFPLSELQCAVLIPQFQLLHERNEVRMDRAKRLSDAIFESGIELISVLPLNNPENLSAFYKYPMMLHSDRFTKFSKPEVIAAFQNEGLPIDEGFRGFTSRSNRRCRKAGSLERAKLAAKNTLLLHHPVLLEPAENFQSMIDAICRVCKFLENN